MPRTKPLFTDALEKAGENQSTLAHAMGFSYATIQQAAHRRIDAEKAGVICRHLAERSGLSGKERKALFTELVNLPGRSESLTSRVSTENPMENLWELRDIFREE